ncbi:hypothetical protein QOS_0300, partial [Clostridioides difficile Y184]
IYHLIKESNKKKIINNFLDLLNEKLLKIKGLESLIRK